MIPPSVERPPRQLRSVASADALARVFAAAFSEAVSIQLVKSPTMPADDVVECASIAAGKITRRFCELIQEPMDDE